MWHLRPIRTVMYSLVALAVLPVLGCGGKGGVLSAGEKNLQALAVMWGRYISNHRGQSPPNEAEFKKFIQTSGKDELSTMGVDVSDIQQLFTSPRDNQPYGFAYKVQATIPGADGTMPMVIWERTGVNGKRMVADSLGKIEEIDDAEFTKRSSGLPKGK